MSVADASGSGTHKEHLKYLWGGCFVVVAVLALGYTPWDAVTQVLANEGGVGDEQMQLLAFVAGYTLPLAAGACAATALYFLGAFEAIDPAWRLATVAAILAVAGWLSTALGLGLAPGVLEPASGPPQVSIPMMVIRAYVSTYSWPLAWSALTIGFVGGLHIEVSYREYVLGETTDG